MPLIKKLGQPRLLLDTYVWIWLLEDSRWLSKSFKKAVDGIQERNGLLISSITIWELGMLYEKERIALEMDVMEWVENALSIPGLQLIDLTPKIAIQSTRLPGVVHGDLQIGF